MMVRHIRVDRRQFYLFEALGKNNQQQKQALELVLRRALARKPA